MTHLATNPPPRRASRPVPPGWRACRPRSRCRTAGTVVVFAEGREIFAQGDDTDQLFKVVSGVVRICKFLSDGRRQIEALPCGGRVFRLRAWRGTAVFRRGGKRLYPDLLSPARCGDAGAERPGGQPAAFPLRHAGPCPGAGTQPAAGQARRGEKVAAFLLGWAALSPDKQVVSLAMSRQDIGDYLGLTIETVSRTLSQFERDGVIALPNARQVRLRNIEMLEDIAA